MPARVVRRMAGALLVLAIAGAGAYALVGVFSARDSSNLSAPSGPGQSAAGGGDAHLRPGTTDPVYATNPPTSGAHVDVVVVHDDVALSSDELLSALERGNVVLVYGDPARRPALRALAASLAGPFTPALAAAGQAVILDPLSTAPRGAITVLAWGHALHAGDLAQPSLAAFVNYWLGRGAPGAGMARSTTG